MSRQATAYRFGPYELRVKTRELHKQGIKLKLRPQPFQVLKVLVERAGDIVTREELRQQLWSAETFVDFEQGLNTSIKVLRGVLSDSANEPRYIETLPKLGYRMIVSVEADQPPQVTEANTTSQTTVEEDFAGKDVPLDHAPKVLDVRRLSVLLGIFVVLIVGLGGYFEWSRSRERPQASNGRLMLAVLPFENLTGDVGQDYFSDGLTEEMIAQLGRLDPERLGVIARTSVMHYKHSQEQLKQIGRELGVQYVLEGSVRRDSEKVRISAQLIQMKDQTHVWARQYDRELINLLALQGEIAQEIADGIQLTLGDHRRIDSARQAPLSPNAYEAYDLYLKGRFFWNKRTTQGFQHAIEYFEQAVAKDPTYARAYAGLADSYTLMSGYSLAPQNEFMPKARAAAQRAVELDDGLAEAHTSLALVTENYDWDWQNAEKEYRRAIQLDPNYATAHHWYAEYLSYQGRFDEAFAEIERARQLDPLSLIIATDNGAILYFSRQYDRAIEQFRAVLDMEPNFPRAHLLVFAYVQKGLFADALADIEKWRRIDDVPGSWAVEAYVNGRSGQWAEARRALEKLLQLNRRRRMDPAAIALAYVGMGNKDEALVQLQKAYSERSNALTALKVDPIYDPLRSDPRFKELMRRLAFPP
ncbi:MAG: winged helix-turn-helix domain-containing tetratricopeptide repeat protein [Candidatus Acidiferrales bacterium]